VFVFTAVSHFHPRTRRDFVRMVPVSPPAPALLVSVAGVLEFLGVIDLMLSWAQPAVALGLIGLLVAIFPANVHAAREGLMIGGRRGDATSWSPATAALLDRRRRRQPAAVAALLDR
jgi:uncharacterized membrane protein